MISPYVRRLRLAGELRALRAESGLTHEQLAKRIGESRAQISRLENGHIVDQADVMKILDALRVRGNLEAGAMAIREYKQTFLPGLLQIPAFVKARSDADGTLGPLSFTVDGVLAGNAGRQRMLRRPGAPTYEVIVDEVAVRRLSAPPDIFKKQLYHLATVCNNSEPKVSLRVLPVDARIDSYTVPRCTFSIYTYPDPGDPAGVAIDTVTSDLILTGPGDVAPYEQLYARLRDAALPQAESLALLTTAATELPDQ